MTCQYSSAEWADVLYTSIRNTPGGVGAAAVYLTSRRGKAITKENLRLRLRGEGENRLSVEMFELLIEWLQDCRQPNALDALHALNEQFGLRAADASQGEDLDPANALIGVTLAIAKHSGEVAGAVKDALEDNVVSVAEASAITSAAREQQRALDHVIRLARALMRGPRPLFRSRG
ncbi:phage regulatory CII family protein [Burkholderia gladioli]|uniref:phage regulatory CII family protein n=1 Tax=Burkholderia gladioli TaxID=28095 RepID=UPI00163F52E5|nr:phage regulatory CII family protein [Burkholderia gladioli]